jgi:hypothetical protein
MDQQWPVAPPSLLFLDQHCTMIEVTLLLLTPVPVAAVASASKPREGVLHRWTSFPSGDKQAKEGGPPSRVHHRCPSPAIFSMSHQTLFLGFTSPRVDGSGCDSPSSSKDGLPRSVVHRFGHHLSRAKVFLRIIFGMTVLHYSDW